jgi:hypothetical protein
MPIKDLSDDNRYMRKQNKATGLFWGLTNNTDNAARQRNPKQTARIQLIWL